jgi:hypothetical protein
MLTCMSAGIHIYPVDPPAVSEAQRMGLVAFLVTANQTQLQLEEITSRFRLRFDQVDFMTR